MTEKNRNRAYQPGLEVVPGYTLVRSLGSGMAGDVWVARAAGGTLVAVKIVRSLSKLGGRKEFQALKTLRNIRHPNLCPVHGFWTKDANGQLLRDGETQANLPNSSVFDKVKPKGSTEETEAMLTGTMTFDSVSMVTPDEPKPEVTYPKAEELIVVMGLGDCTLHDRLMEVRGAAGIPEKSTAEVCGLQADEVIEYLRAASKAIDELNHKHNIYHCDIKPQNILKVGGGIQVCDFGLANRIEQDVRETQQAFASVAYGAPEVLNDSTYSRTVDQYSLAITYYELRTGVLPFDATTFAKVVLAKSAEEFDLSHVSNAEQKVLKKATRKDPKERYESCSEFIDAMAIASGVDKRSGITPKRAGIAATLALALIGGLVYSLVNRSDAATHLGHADAAVYEIEEKTQSAQADAIEMSLNDIRKANDANPTSDQQVKIKQFASQWSDQLVLWVLTETNVCVSDDWSNGELATRYAEAGDATENKRSEQKRVESCRAYLATIEQLYSDHAVLDPASEKAMKLRTAVGLAHTQLDLITDVKPNDQNVSLLRESLRRSGLNTPETLQQALTVAVTHRETGSGDGLYGSEVALRDIATAQQAYVNFAGQRSTVQPWLLRRWKIAKDRFVAESERKLESGRASAMLRRTIEENFPTHAVDALVRDLETRIENNEWAEFQTKSSELAGLVTKSPKLKASYGAASDMYQWMGRALEDLADADTALEQLAMRLIPDSKSDDVVDRERSRSVDLWISEVAKRLLNKPQQLDFPLAKKIYNSGVLLRPNDGKKALERLIMVAAIRAGPDAMKDETFETVLREPIDGDEPFNSLLRAAIRLERDPSGRDLPAASLIEGLTDKPTQEVKARRSKLMSMTSRAYMSYLYLLAQYSNDSNDILIWSLFDPSNKYAAQTRQTLHPKRRARIVDVLLDKAISESGVDNIAVLQRRYVDQELGRKRVADADWWLQDLDSEASEAWQRVTVEKLLVDVANKPSHESLAKVQIPDSLQKLIQDPPDDFSQFGQLYRAAFEIKLASCRSKSDQATADDVNGLLKSAIGMANIAFPESVNKNGALRDQWNQRILGPAMNIVVRFSERSDTQSESRPTGKNESWAFKIPIDATIVSDFARFCLEAEEPGLSDFDRLTELEIAASVRASDDRVSDDERVRMLLKCCRFVESQSGDMPSEQSLQFLTCYLDRAASIQPDNPEVKLKQAIQAMNLAMSSDNAKALLEAVSKADQAIAVLKNEQQTERQRIALYDAYWRTANADVTLAFLETQDIRRKKEILERAQAHALGAKAMLTEYSLSGDVTTNQTYMVLGNIYEDLAHYCEKELLLTERLRAFQNAEEAFEKAVGATKNPLQARYSLARCLYRHALVDLPNTTSWIAKADAATGGDDTFNRFKNSSTPRTRQQWNLWKSHIEEKRNRRAEAIDYMMAACAEKGGDITTTERSVVLMDCIRLLTNIDSNASEALTKSRFVTARDRLHEIENSNWAQIAEQCQIFGTQPQHDGDVIQIVDDIPQARFLEIDEDREQITEHIAVISDVLRQIGTAATESLRRLQSRARGATKSAKADHHLRIVDANLFCLEHPSEQDHARRVQQYLSLFDNISVYHQPLLVRLHRALLFVCWIDKNKQPLESSAIQGLGELLPKLTARTGNDLGNAKSFNDRQINELKRIKAETPDS